MNQARIVHNLRAAIHKEHSRSNKLFSGGNSGNDDNFTVMSGRRHSPYNYVHAFDAWQYKSAVGTLLAPENDMPDLFLEWNQQDFRIRDHRNNIIYSYQGNHVHLLTIHFCPHMGWSTDRQNN